MLTTLESSRLEQLEIVIEDNMQPFYAVGTALTEINESRLYRAAHGTFEDYCSERWSFKKSQAYRLIEAAAIVKELSPIGGKILPSHERQVRALATVPAGQRGEVWNRAVTDNGGRQPSGRQIEEAADPGSVQPPSPIRITGRGLEFVGPINEESLREGMKALKTSKDSFHCALADLMKVGGEKLGEEAVGRALEDLEYDHDDAMRAEALNRLPPAARDLGLTASHYVAAVKAKELTSDGQRMDWLRKAKKHMLTPLQFKRSIIAGKIVTNEDVQEASGRGSGILTIENVVFQASQWHKHINRADPIAAWEAQKAKECLEKLAPVFTIINELVAASKKK